MLWVNMGPLSRINLLQSGLERKFPDRDNQVSIIGLGAVGSWVLRILVVCGYRNYILLDNDVLKETDFNRNALFDWDGVGRYKVELGEELIRKFLSHLGNVRVVLIKKSIGKSNGWQKELQTSSFVFDCIDGLNGKANLMRFLWKNGIPFVSSGSTARKISLDAVGDTLSKVKEDPLLSRVRRRLISWGVEVEKIPVVYLKGKTLPLLGPVSAVATGRDRQIMGSWILSPMAVAIKMVNWFLLGDRDI